MTSRRSVNIYDYPEHLNPFFEDDNHTKLRFWTSTKKKPRSNSFSFQSIKDFKQSLFSRPAIRKRSGTSSSSSQLSCYHTHEKNDEFSRSDEKRKSIIYPTLRKLGRSFSIRSKNKKTRDASADRTTQSPENEAAYSYTTRSTVSSRQTMPAETYREPVTPLPRIRFHERLRNTDVEKTDESKPASPVDDKNPFKDEDDVIVPSTPSTSKPTTPPRKKKRAPPPPPMRQSSLTRKSLSAEFSLCEREHEDNTADEMNHKAIERTEIKVDDENPQVVQIPKIEVENEKPDSEIKTTEVEPETKTELKENSSSQENIPSSEEVETTSSIEETEPFQINYNSELNISSSQISISSETRLEQQQQQHAVEDSSDLLELVQKLQLEVEKLTDDTNNNVIASTFNSNKTANLYDGYDGSMNTSVKTEINMNLDGQDDDNDVVIGAPLSPRFVRLRKDNEWIKH